jgi:hypothetical protein
VALVVTFDKTAEQCSGSTRTTYGSLAMGSLYPSNGEPFTARMFGLTRLYQLHVCPSQGYVFEPVGLKLKAYWADYNALSDGPLVECPNNTDLSAVTGARWKAVGL